MLYLCVYTDPGWRGDEYEGTFPGEVRIGLYEADSAETARRKMARRIHDGVDDLSRVQATPVDGAPLRIEKVL